jgi:uncharacterized protein
MMQDSDIKNIEKALTELIRTAGKLAVAFSGGVDSSYLLYKAHEVLGDDSIAVTVKSQVLTDEEFSETVEFCRKLGAKQIIIDFDVFTTPLFASNPPDRCYHCKRNIFENIIKAAPGYVIADGSNTDDTGDYRPGMRAIKELNIMSPLMEAGLSKNDIRLLSKEAGLSSWDHPSAACLASRFAYGEKITADGLSQVAAAEKYIKSLGFKGIRVRVHGNIARIEALSEDITLLSAENTRKAISAEFKKLGFKYVTLDLDGYRTGSMNEVLK